MVGEMNTYFIPPQGSTYKATPNKTVGVPVLRSAYYVAREKIEVHSIS